MKTIKNAFLILIVLCSYNLQAQLEYPTTKKIPVVDTYHGVEIIDNYQWLENMNTPEVKTWVDEQNKVSFKYFKNFQSSKKSKNKLEEFSRYEMWYPDYSSSSKNSKAYFRLMYPGKNQPLTIYFAKGNKASFEKLVGPNSISRKDKIVFTDLTPSFDDRFLAYEYNRNGSDWKEIKIVGVKKRKFFNETLKDILSPEINWYGQGFFYIKNTHHKEQARGSFPEVMYHTLDTEQSEDKKILGVTNKNEDLNIFGLPDQTLYIIKKSNKLNNHFSYSYLRPKNDKKEFKSLFKDIEYDMQFVQFKSDTLIAITDINNKKYMAQFPINEPKKWSLLSPTYENAVFTGYAFAENKIVSSFETETASIIAITDFKGNVLGEIITPEGLSVSDLIFNERRKVCSFTLSSYTVPPVTCQLDLSNFTFKYIGKTEVSFDATKYRFMRKQFTSHDGKKIPIFIVYKDSIPKDGQTPFLLNTYGGYGTIAKPNFDPGIIYFIENGGAFAYVHVRGGGEFGHEWWEEGRKLKKINGILDFTHAATYLIKEGYSKPGKIGIMGTSHGGLVTAASLVTEPSLFGAAIINVGALDMIRFELTEVGSTYTHSNEFGTVEKKDEFMNLYSYSPYHNIKDSINYPSTLIITGSDDTRVEPHQSYKFAGKLQNGLNQKNPILLWSQDKAGHYGANEYNLIFEQTIFKYNFLLHELNNNN